jgi:hypothetical protein
LGDSQGRLPSLASLEPDVSMPVPGRYAYRSFDQRFALLDNRLGDRMRPSLHRSYGDRQIFLTSLLTAVLGKGPAAVATALIPDLHHFCNRGAKDVIPFWRDAATTQANVTAGLLEVLGATYGHPIHPEDLFAYAYALLATPEYVKTFWDELALPGPRLPLTRDPALFAQGVALGRELMWLHTYGERCVPPGEKPVGFLTAWRAVRWVRLPIRRSIPNASTTIPRRRNCTLARAGSPRCAVRCGTSASPASRW